MDRSFNGTPERVLHHANRLCPCLDGRSDLGETGGRISFFMHFICFIQYITKFKAMLIGSDGPSGLHASSAGYTRAVLMIYDLWVTHFSNRYVWRCCVEIHRDHYRKWIGKRHLEVGVGTGYYLSGATLREVQHVALLDPNPLCLAAAKRRIGSVSCTTYCRDALLPISIPEEPFDSIAVSYLLHCLPGPIRNKAILFENLAPLLSDTGVLFGSTILGAEVDHNRLGRQLMRIYNGKGVFDNEDDRFEDLRGCLKSRLRVTDHRGVMPITINTDKLYDTDLTDAAWALIGPMLPAAGRGGRPRTTNIRAVLNAIFIYYEQAANGVCFPESFQCGALSITTSEPGRTVMSGLASSAQCTSKLDGKPVEPPVRRSSSWMASR